MNSLKQNAQIFSVLVRRELKVTGSNIVSILADCLSPLVTQVVTFGYLFPLIGQPQELIAPIYLGSMISLFLQLGFSLIMRIGFDLDQNRFIDYKITLPLTKTWLISAYIISNMAETAMIVLPVFFLGIMMLNHLFTWAAINIIGLMIIIVCILLFFSTFYLAMAFKYNLQWSLDNFWPRRMIPLFIFSSALVVWQKVFVFWPTMAYIMLLSPITYVAEGLRAALLGGDMFISVYICAGALIVFTVLNLWLIAQGLQERLDPV